jgi:Kef-type K+ transport system membrane component KefB/mannitol/fructose-specific phosphotransferase system IIA component (Ntr-type)
MHYLSETHIFIFLVQIFVLLLCTRGLGLLFNRWGQPALTAELLVGVVLGPTLLGRFFPGIHAALFPSDIIQQNMLETVSWIGVLFLLMGTGLEIDFTIAWRQRGNALTIALADVIIPMLVAFIPCLFLPAHYMAQPDQRWLFALFMATVMTISAMPVAARVLHELNLLKTNMGFLVMSALAVNDIFGWVLFTIVLSLFTHGGMHLGAVAGIFAATAGFAVLALTAGRRLSTVALGALQKRKMPEPATSLTFVCLLGLLFGAITQKLGIHALFGFFIAGVVMGEAKNLSEETRGILTQMVYAIFVPLFFANIGLKMDFAQNFDFGLALFMCAIGIAGRYLGAWVGVTLTAVPRSNRDLIAIAHTPGGMMEVVVALLAFQSGLITAKVFVAIVFSALFSSMILGPWMRFALNRRKKVRAADYLSADSILPALAAVDRAGAIRELAAVAAARQPTLTVEEIVRPALQREQEFGTAVGSGLAIPHVRLKGLTRPLLVFARSAAGLNWDAPDGRPVHYIFLLVTPEDAQDLHVQILAAIARAVLRPETGAALEHAPDAETLWQALQEGFSVSGAPVKTA